MNRLVDRLRDRAAERFVGRRAELALIGASLAADPPQIPVFVVHGPGGVGKTTLLEQARRLAAAQGIDSLRLDARDIEPTPHGLLRALGAAQGLAPSDATLGRVLESWSQAPRRLLVIDTFECLAHLDGWMRGSLLPELPESTRVIIAGRSLDPAWTTDALWREGARVIGLRNLERADCERHLGARGVDPRHHEAIIQLSHGHPLALTLLADVVLATGEVPPVLGTDLVRQLAELFTAHAVTDRQRRALEVCAHARVTTEPILAETVDNDQAHELFDWLARLSFVELGPAGLFPHDLVREAIDDELHWRDKERYRENHVALRRYLVRRVRSGAPQAASHTFDILYLHRRSPVMRPFIDYTALGSMFFERSGAHDLPALRALMRSELPAAEHPSVERWFVHPATSAWAVRPSESELAGATLSIDLAALTDEERASEPLFGSVWSALQKVAPPRAGDLQLLARWTLAAGGQCSPSAAMNALQMSQFYQWLTQPRLGTFILCVGRPDYWAPMMKHLRFERLEGCDMELEGVAFGCYLHDWRREPMEQWLGVMAEREIGGAPAVPGGPLVQRLAKAEFERAVRDALRLYGDRAALDKSPLALSASVNGGRAGGEPPGAALQRMLLEAAQALRERPRDQKFWRALELTYFRPAGSQELAAERLGLPFGTYRYQLATGIERVVQAMWAREAN
jgi:hypothetical protein